MLITKEVEIVPCGTSIKYYRNLGYDVKYHVPLIVKVEDLPRGSNIKVDVLCDYCKKEIITMRYCDYLHKIKIVNKSACKNCKSLKLKDCNLKKYGVENTTQLDWVKDKMIQTNYERYGVSHYSKTDEYKEKFKNTMMNKYGVEHALQSKEFNDKYKQTCSERYGENYMKLFLQQSLETYYYNSGYSNPFCSTQVKNKIAKTNLKKYGVEHPSQSPEIREKMVQTFYKNSSQKTSSQQLYLHNLYGGELNYPISQYNADICFPEEKITIEYNGGFHAGNVITGRITQEEFNQKEIIRNNIIKRAGYKQITIISSKDFLPSDEILLKMLEQAKQYFNTTNHTWVEYNIDTSLMQNAENKEGVFFDFGELRKIKKAS